MLSTRILSALILIPFVATMVYLGGGWFAGLVAVFAALATIEFYQIAERLDVHPSKAVGAVLSAVLVIAALFPSLHIGPAALLLALPVLMLVRVLRQDYDGFLGDWATTLVGSIYIGGLLSQFVLMRGLRQGLAWVSLVALATWAGDTAAYLVGTSWGRRPFFPKVSPRKTLEGALSGIGAGTLFATAIAIIFLHLSWPLAVILGLLLSLATTFGDLSESLLKRQSGIKDSGNLIPGHGGALDRVDSLLFAGLVAYYFAIWVAGASFY